MTTPTDSAPFITGLGLSQYVYGAQRLGLPAQELLTAAGLDLELSLQPAQRIPVPQFEHFLLQLILHSGDELLGFHIGHQVMPAMYGVFPSLGFSAANGREALLLGVRYQALAGGTSSGFDVTEKPDALVFTWTMVHQNPVIRRHVTDNVLALLAHMVRFIGGRQDLGANGLSFEWSAPSAEVRRQMEAFYGSPIRFNANVCQIEIGRDVLDMPLNLRNPEQLQAAEELARRQLAEQQQSLDWLSQVKRQMYDLIAARAPRREIVADRLNISVRTLDRRLAEQQISWQQLLDSIRSSMAHEYLADPSLSIQAIATRLGFADVRAFQRRFRHWSGMAPSEYRQQLDQH